MTEWKTPTAEECELVRKTGIPEDHFIVSRPGEDMRVFMSVLDRTEVIACKKGKKWETTVFPSAY